MNDETLFGDLKDSPMEYSATTCNATTEAGIPYSTKDMVKAIRKLEWFGYEVDPEWARFCEFSADDIGGPFEKLGIIRKRPRYDAVVMNQRAYDAMSKAAENICLYGFDPGKGDSFSAMNVVASDLMPPDSAYLVDLRPYMFAVQSPFSGIKFGET
jgi:3-methyladenine DNA glycosylase Tag